MRDLERKKKIIANQKRKDEERNNNDKMKESDTSKIYFERQFVSAFNQASGFHYLLSHKSSFMHIEPKRKNQVPTKKFIISTEVVFGRRTHTYVKTW